VAAVEASFAWRGAFLTGANRAACAGRPQPRLEIETGRFVVREQPEELKRRYGDFVVHASKVADSLAKVKGIKCLAAVFLGRKNRQKWAMTFALVTTTCE